MNNETKQERFVRVAEKRVNRILENLRLLSNCSNRRMYSWEEDQIRKIWNVIDKEVKECKQAFGNTSSYQYTNYTMNQLFQN